MGNKIAVYFSGVRLIDIGDLKLDNIANDNSDLTKFLDMKYYNETKQIDLIMDIANHFEHETSNIISAEDVYRELGITKEDIEGFEDIEFE